MIFICIQYCVYFLLNLFRYVHHFTWSLPPSIKTLFSNLGGLYLWIKIIFQRYFYIYFSFYSFHLDVNKNARIRLVIFLCISNHSFRTSRLASDKNYELIIKFSLRSLSLSELAMNFPN